MFFSAVRRRVSVLVTLVAVGLTVVAILRALRVESSPSMILLMALSPILLLPAYVVAGYGIATRRRALAVVGSILVVAQIFWALPELSFGDGTDDPVDLRLATANVLADNESVGVLFESLAARDADIVLFQEVTPQQLARLEESASYVSYPHRVLDPRPGAYGSVILSKFPISQGGVIWPAGWPMTEAVVQPPTGGPVRIMNVHTVAPLANENIPIWQQQFADLKTMTESSSEPVIIAGDFNATAQHSGVADLRGVGLRDAHIDAGTGWGGTFPAGSLVPAMLRLDRVLVAEQFTTVSLERLDPLGSDHHSLLAELAL